MIIDTTRPTPDGNFLWRVCFRGSYYDNDPRMPGDVPVIQSVYVLAGSAADAIKLAEPHLASSRKRATRPESVKASIITLEDLKVATEPEAPGGSWYNTESFVEVKLSENGTSQKYRLGVCLIPIEQVMQ